MGQCCAAENLMLPLLMWLYDYLLIPL